MCHPKRGNFIFGRIVLRISDRLDQRHDTLASCDNDIVVIQQSISRAPSHETGRKPVRNNPHRKSVEPPGKGENNK